MDMLQLVFAFVNAPLFATFAFGMFWKRTTGHGAFSGLLAGMTAAMVHHGLSLPIGASVGIHGGFFGAHIFYRSELAQAFWTAIVAFIVCSLVTVIVSLATQAPQEDRLHGLVYSLTPRMSTSHMDWYRTPQFYAGCILAGMLLLDIWFF